MCTTPSRSVRWSISPRSPTPERAVRWTCLTSREGSGAPIPSSTSSTPDAVGDEVVAVVLARGLGRRMQETPGSDEAALTPEQKAAASAGLKSMMPVAEPGRPARPFLDYVLSELADAG